jgi:hypothetical protein
MNDADLEIVGDRPGVFEFFSAGYSKNTPANGLAAQVADYSRFSAAAFSGPMMCGHRSNAAKLECKNGGP